MEEKVLDEVSVDNVDIDDVDPRVDALLRNYFDAKRAEKEKMDRVWQNILARLNK